MISVCIATHNGAPFIEEQLSSILSQLSSIDEIIVSDDGSTDKTLDIIYSFSDNRIKVYKFQQPDLKVSSHIRVAQNFQNALNKARGDYIFLSDQDDIWLENKITVCINKLKDYDLVQHNLFHVDGQLNITGIHYKDGFKFKNYFIRSNGYHGCSMAFRREILDYVLPFPKNLPLHDYWIGILAESCGRVCYIDKPLMLYRIHGSNVSGKSKNSYIYRILYRIQIMWNIILRICLTRVIKNKSR